MSTQDDPENLPWQNNELRVRGLLHPPKPNSPIQFYYESVVPSAWLGGATTTLGGVSATLGARAMTAHLGSSGGVVITPGAGSLTLAPQHLEVNVSDDVSVEDSSESPSRLFQPQAPDGLVMNTSVSDSEAPVRGSNWLTRLTWFIPKEIREPWRGDLLEDREKMASEGCSRLHIEWASVTQLLWLLLSRLGARIAWFWLIYTRLSEWFMHNR